MFSEMLGSFLMAFFFFFIVFLINQILLFAEDILAAGADLVSVAKLLFFSLPTILAITIPFSVLAATLMASSRQHADNEFMASSTLGIRPVWLYMPFLIAGLVFALGSFLLNDWSIPRASKGYKRVYAELIRGSAKIELAPYSIKRYGNTLLITGQSDAGALRDIVIVDQKPGGDSSVTSAKEVTLDVSEDSLAAILSMRDLTEEKRPAGGARGDFSISTATSATVRIQIQDQIPNFSGTAPSEMSITALARQIREKKSRLLARVADNTAQLASAIDRLSLEYDAAALALPSAPAPVAKAAPATATAPPTIAAAPNKTAAAALGSIDALRNQRISDTSLQVYRLEYQKKFVIPSACFFFAFLAFPLGIGSRRAGRTAGFGLALLLSVLYWGLLFAGQTLGYRQNFSPLLSMWMPNLIMLFAALLLWISRKLSTGHFL